MRKAEFDIIVYGATGFTGRLVAEYLCQRGITGWAMAGRSAAKLAEVRDLVGAPADTPLVVADADDAASIRAMCARARTVITTVGPYQLYGNDLVAACAETGASYVDLCGEPVWMPLTRSQVRGGPVCQADDKRPRPVERVRKQSSAA